MVPGAGWVGLADGHQPLLAPWWAPQPLEWPWVLVRSSQELRTEEARPGWGLG